MIINIEYRAYIPKNISPTEYFSYCPSGLQYGLWDLWVEDDKLGWYIVPKKIMVRE